MNYRHAYHAGNFADVVKHAVLCRMLVHLRDKPVAIDGWTALTAYVPPNERRGVVLIDPPFEQPDEFARLAERLSAAHRKWPTGTYLLWYPIKDEAAVAAFIGELARSRIAK